MRSILCTAFLYLALSLLVLSCTEADAPAPACIGAEVVGEDCSTGWYILKLDETPSARTTGSYIGQLQGGYVTTDNLPAQHRQPGLKLKVALELNSEYSPKCVTVAVMYTAVKVVDVCAVVGAN